MTKCLVFILANNVDAHCSVVAKAVLVDVPDGINLRGADENVFFSDRSNNVKQHRTKHEAALPVEAQQFR